MPGYQWYAGEGPPFEVPLTSWIPNAVVRSPVKGDWYLDVVTGVYYEFIPPDEEPEQGEITDEELWNWMGEKDNDE